MASVGRSEDARWWRLQSDRRLAIEATARGAQVELTFTGVTSKSGRVQTLCVVEARYYGVDRPEFGRNGQIQRVAMQFQLDVLTDAALPEGWTPLTDVGEITHPPDAYGPGTTLAVWVPPGLTHPAHHDAVFTRNGTTRG